MKTEKESLNIEYLKNRANMIRLHAVRMTAKAGSGHPTSAMSCAEILSVLYLDQMVCDPAYPESPEGDDFVISKGHGSPGLYAVLKEGGMLQDEDLMDYRTCGSILEGHPVPAVPGVRLATGSLGQGLSFGMGLACAMKLDRIERNVYVLMGDGEMAEGNIWEAVNLAPHLGLNNLIGIIDVNRLGQSGPTLYEWDTDAYSGRVRSFGWHTQVVDGHDAEALIRACEEARKDERPSMIIARTVKGKGVSFLENAEGRHGKPLSEEELEIAEKELEHEVHTEYAPEKKRALSPRPVPDSRVSRVEASYSRKDMVATRTAYGSALEKLCEQDGSIAVLDGDVKNSTRTRSIFERFSGRAVECYIAEQNMIGMAAGLQARDKKVHVATFAAFLTRAHDQIRMAAYSQADIKITGSHTGVSIGEDGPSQMGLEDIAMMRSIHGSIVLSPCDGVSAEKLVCLMNDFSGISYMRTIRGKTPVIYSNSETFQTGGSNVLEQSDNNVCMIMATGITVHEALKAVRLLGHKGISAGVMDIYSLKPVDRQGMLDATSSVQFILTAEDHYAQGGLGESVCSAIGTERKVYVRAVSGLPHSGPPEKLMQEQGIDAAGIAEAVEHICLTIDSIR